MGASPSTELRQWRIEVSYICRALCLTNLTSYYFSSISYYFHLKGSIIDGTFVPIAAPSAGSCASSGIKYPLKSGTPVSTSSSGSSSPTKTSSSVGLFAIHLLCRLKIVRFFRAPPHRLVPVFPQRPPSLVARPVDSCLLEHGPPRLWQRTLCQARPLASP